MIHLGVNISYVASLQARRGDEPDPVLVAVFGKLGEYSKWSYWGVQPPDHQAPSHREVAR